MPVSRPRARRDHRRRRPAPRDPPDLPLPLRLTLPCPARLLDRRLHSYQTGLLSTHFPILFQAGDFAAELKLLISVTSFFLSCDLDE